jgi:hypothetical protein
MDRVRRLWREDISWSEARIRCSQPRAVGDQPGVLGLVNQLAFSASGQYLLTYTLFAIWRQAQLHRCLDGSVAYQSKTAKFGVWDRAGNRLYFMAATAVSDLRDGGGTQAARRSFGSRLRAISGRFFFGRLLVLTRTTLGIPTPWRLVIATRTRSQVSSATSAVPVFVGSDYWSSEGVPCQCGPMGTSQSDGRLIAHNMRTGVNSVVLEVARLTPSQSPTNDIVDVWFG